MPQLSQLFPVYPVAVPVAGDRARLHLLRDRAGMVPKIQATVDAREQHIAGDLEAAQNAGLAADETEAARDRMDAARAEAARVSQDAKAESGRDTEAKVKAAADRIGAKIEAAQAKIRQSVDSARAEIERPSRQMPRRKWCARCRV